MILFWSWFATESRSAAVNYKEEASGTCLDSWCSKPMFSHSVSLILKCLLFYSCTNLCKAWCDLPLGWFLALELISCSQLISQFCSLSCFVSGLSIWSFSLFVFALYFIQSGALVLTGTLGELPQQSCKFLLCSCGRALTCFTSLQMTALGIKEWQIYTLLFSVYVITLPLIQRVKKI